MTDTVKITLTDGTEMHVHPDTPVLTRDDADFWHAEDADVHTGTVTRTVFEPMREFWAPYEPWMRDVLADDARVSWRVTSESRAAWSSARRVLSDALAARYDLRVHPDDTPEKPTEDDPDEALTKVIASAFYAHLDFADIARAAREQIAQEADRADFNAAVDYHARAVKAEADRDKWKEEAAEAHSQAIEDDENQQAEAWLRIIRHPVLAAVPASGLKGSYLDAVLARLDALAKAEGERDAAKEEAAEAHSAAIFAEQRAGKAEAERDEWKARHAALRADLAGCCPGGAAAIVVRGILDRDDERGERDA